MLRDLAKSLRNLYPVGDTREYFQPPKFADPIVSLVAIIGKRIGAIGTFLLLCGIYFVIPGLLSFMEGTAFHRAPDFLSYFDDVFGIANYALTYPLLLMALVSYYETMDTALEYVKRSVLSPEQAPSFAQFIRRLDRRLSARWIWAVPLLVTVAIVLWYQDQFKALGALKVYGGGGQGELTFLGIYWFAVVIATLAFALFSVLIRHTIFVLSLREFLRDFSLHLRPKDPDRSSGLAPLGNVFIQGAWVATLVGIIVMSFAGLGATAGFGYRLLLIRVMLATPFYLIVIPAVLGYPIWIIHRAMVREQNIRLAKISESVNQYLELVASLQVARLDLMKDRSSQLSDVKNWYSLMESAYSIVEHTPLWPVNFGSLRFVTPILSLLLSPFVTTAARALLHLVDPNFPV